MMTRRSLLASPAGLLAFQGSPEPAIIPRPVRLTPSEGTFTLGPTVRIFTDAAGRPEADALGKALACAVASGKERDGAISLALDPGLNSLGPEGYLLQVTPKRVVMRAPQRAGLYWATHTLRHLMPPEVYAPSGRGGLEWRLPCLEIEDRPRFSWRGGHVDVARHFKPKQAILRYIDALAIHKINTLHLHLTDDQGWRIEIRKYPKLTEIGSVRKHTRAGHENRSKEFDNRPHSGFYSQSDIREIVAYAAARHITVVPEIEMPGHAMAALAAYPELGNNPKEPVEVWGQWGISKRIFNVKDETFRFLEDVLSEVLDLFPSKYIHVGGDEVPYDEWRQNPEVQERKKQLGFTTEAQVHSWFIGRINTFLKSRGRILIGWDEIIEGGMTPGAVVMSWRGTKGGIEAARHGHDVVMTPTSHTYFDYYQSKDTKNEPLAIGGFVDVEKVYSFEPVPPELAEHAQRVLGTQGQLWTEYMPSAEHMEYMAFPRMSALAEVAWTARERRDYADFKRRLQSHVTRLKALGVRFRPLDQ